MKTMHRTRLKFEKRELTLIHFSRNTSFFCRICEAETQHLTVSQTANALKISEKNIFRLTEKKEVHSIETDNGQLLICANSSASFEKLQEKL